jgi:hypothetical protein
MRKKKAKITLWESKEVMGKYKGTKFLKPSPELAREIDEKADAIMKNRNKRARASA